MRIRDASVNEINRVLGQIVGRSKPILSGSSTHAAYQEQSPPAYNDVLVSAAGMKVPTSAAPTEAAWKTSLKKWLFAATGGEYLYIEGMQLPHFYVEGTDLNFHVHFAPTTALADGETVIWTLTYTLANVWDVFPATATATATFTNNATERAKIPADSKSGTSILADAHLIAGGATISGDGVTISAILEGRLERSAADTFAGDVLLLSADSHIQVNRLGSREQYRG